MFCDGWFEFANNQNWDVSRKKKPQRCLSWLCWMNSILCHLGLKNLTRGTTLAPRHSCATSKQRKSTAEITRPSPPCSHQSLHISRVATTLTDLTPPTTDSRQMQKKSLLQGSQNRYKIHPTCPTSTTQKGVLCSQNVSKYLTLIQSRLWAYLKAH